MHCTFHLIVVVRIRLYNACFAEKNKAIIHKFIEAESLLKKAVIFQRRVVMITLTMLRVILLRSQDWSLILSSGRSFQRLHYVKYQKLLGSSIFI